MNEMDRLKREPSRWLRWMPNWLEFCLIFGLTLWPFVYSSLGALFTTLPDAPITENGLSGLMVYEILLLVLVVPLLHARGWTVASLGLCFERRDIIRVLAVLAVAYVTYYATWLLFSVAMPANTDAAYKANLVGSALSMGTVTSVSVVNGFFEELFVAGYLIQSLRTRFGVVAAINVSILVRLSYHLYQGAVGVIGIVPLGLVFAWTFVRTGKLWPLIIAHAFIDILSLGLS